MRLSILFIAMLLVLTACRKDKSSNEALLSSFIECNGTQNLDSAAISAKLVGTWTWKKQSNPRSSNFTDADKNIKAIFDSDSTFSVMENSTLVMEGTCKLISYSPGFYSLQTNEYNQYVGGVIYFCGNQLLFVNSFYDGRDNLFEK